MPPRAAAKARRRAGVRSTASSWPTTSATAPAPNASSKAHSTSRACAGATIRRRSGAIPSGSRPAPWRMPCSRADERASHHTTGPRCARRSPACRRRAASARANARAATAPGTSGLISCTASSSRPASLRRASMSCAPSRQVRRGQAGEESEDGGAAAWASRGLPPPSSGPRNRSPGWVGSAAPARSIARIRALRSDSASWGTAADRDGPASSG